MKTPSLRWHLGPLPECGALSQTISLPELVCLLETLCPSDAGVTPDGRPGPSKHDSCLFHPSSATVHMAENTSRVDLVSVAEPKMSVHSTSKANDGLPL